MWIEKKKILFRDGFSPQNHNQHAAEILKGRGQAARGLLTMVLCVIYCSPDKDKIVSEDELFKKLHTHVDSRVSGAVAGGGPLSPPISLFLSLLLSLPTLLSTLPHSTLPYPLLSQWYTGVL